MSEHAQTALRAHMTLLDLAQALADVDKPGRWWTLAPNARARYERMAVVAIEVIDAWDDELDDDELDEETEKAIRESCRCVGCGADNWESGEGYMVHDLLWAAAGMKEDGGWLCVGCLEERLGRELRPDDFTDVPMNRDPWAPRLRAKLGREEAPAA